MEHLVKHPLRRLLYPTRVAIIGASADPQSAGGMLAQSALASIRTRAPELELLLVNPHHDYLYGHPCLRSCEELPEAIDLAVIATPWSAVSGVLTQLQQKQVNAVVCISVATESGWPWESRAGLLKRLQRQLERQLGRKLAPANLRWIGPASPGLMLCERGINLSLCSSFPRAGHVAYVGQSDAIASALGEFGAQRGIGFSHLLTLGDEVDVGIAEMLDFLVDDAPTEAALVYVETIIDPPRFFSALRALASKKPVAVLRAGFQNAGEIALWKALVARCGALAVDDLEQLCDCAHLDMPKRAFVGTRFAVAGNSSALLRLAESAIVRAGFSQAVLSKTTHSALKKLQSEAVKVGFGVGCGIHLGRDAGPKRYSESALALMADPQVDALLLVHHANAFSESQLIATAIALITELRVPVLAAMVGPQTGAAFDSLAIRGIRAFAAPEAAVRAFATHIQLNALLASLTATASPLLELPRTTNLAWLKLVLLIQDQSMNTQQQLQALIAPQATEPLLVELTSLALSVRFLRHADFGRYALVTRLKSSAVVPFPITRAHALNALAQLDIQAEQAPALLRALVRLSDWAAASGAAEQGAQNVQPQLNELTLSASELSLEIAASLSPPDALSAPSAVAIWMHSAGGQRLILRDIRAEDEPALTRGFMRLSSEEIRMRFMFPLKQLTHELAAKLTQLDYRREIALALCAPDPPGQAELFGVARASLDVYQKRAEFAIVIPRALSGQGFGARMLQKLMLRCRRLGMQEIWGDVLIENEAMLALARKLGFDIEPHPDVRHQVRVRKAL